MASLLSFSSLSIVSGRIASSEIWKCLTWSFSSGPSSALQLCSLKPYIRSLQPMNLHNYNARGAASPYSASAAIRGEAMFARATMYSSQPLSLPLSSLDC
ncbi:hypothetical protein QR680_018654 [Steinernema hermaphroditum]|uniref:Uncharacterized protein n=1 Tax=Steinernema hermaphroditum TaxID=289476 RepID=A0AA39HIL8_9BILA|nr:hypothetical protein QR680_018654 [Steinernema hermaphroditum]